MRLDKWLWAARFYKTRSLATDEIGKGRISVNAQSAKPSREVRPGDCIELRQGSVLRTVTVVALSEMRGPAPVAQALYAETAESIALREKAARERRRPSRRWRSNKAARPSATVASWPTGIAGAPRSTTIDSAPALDAIDLAKALLNQRESAPSPLLKGTEPT